MPPIRASLAPARSTSARSTSAAGRRAGTPRPRRLDEAVRAKVLAREAFEKACALAIRPLEEARAFDARHFLELPRPTILELDVPGWAGPVWVRSGEGRGPHPIPPMDPVLDGPLFRELVEVVAADRLRPVDFRTLLGLLSQRTSPSAAAAEGLSSAVSAAKPEPSAEAARRFLVSCMDGVAPTDERLSIGGVLSRLDARLFGVRIEDEVATSFPAWAEAS